jgi:chromosome segregation ATPase
MFCNEIREQKMEEYKKMLESEKVPFLETKLSTLERIKEDEESVNLPCSVLEDIEETKKMLESLTKSHMTVYPVGQQNLPSENQQTISS